MKRSRFNWLDKLLRRKPKQMRFPNGIPRTTYVLDVNSIDEALEVRQRADD